jgi:hypothetical protein
MLIAAGLSGSLSTTLTGLSVSTWRSSSSLLIGSGGMMRR